MWSEITKVIDSFHLPNHKDPECAIKFNPAKIGERFPDLKGANTQVAEGTFAFLGKFKQALFKMPKYRQLFFVHVVVSLRNEYLEKCHVQSKTPLGSFSNDRRHAVDSQICRQP
jgi:hypothetical protein